MQGNTMLSLLLGTVCCAVMTLATPPGSQAVVPTQPPLTGLQTCPVPSEEMLRCMRQWACLYIIRLDLRCLLNLNGNPLLGNLLGATGLTSPVTGSGGNGAGGLLGGGSGAGGLLGGGSGAGAGGGGLLSGILGR